MARFGSRQAMIRYYQAEGFRIGDARCCDCHFHWVAVIEPQTVAWRLECPACHNPRQRGATQSTNHFKEFTHSQAGGHRPPLQS